MAEPQDFLSPNFEKLQSETTKIVDEVKGWAQQWAEATQTSLNDIATKVLAIDVGDIDYTLSELGDVTFAPVTAPDDPSIVDAPITPVLDEISTIASWDLASTPSAPVLSDTPLPISPATLSSIPELAALALPTIPSLPSIDDISYLNHDYSYSEDAYTAKVSAEIETMLKAVFAGGLIIPIALWEDIWDRAVGEIEKVSVGDEWAASELAASLGMIGLPSETFLSRLSIAEQRKAQNISKVRLEQSIQEAQQRREDVWQAVTQGLAYEGMWIQFHNEIAARSLASAVNAYQAKVAIYNANVAVFNAKLQYAAQAVSISQLELQVALAPLQYYAQQLDAIRVEVLQDEQKVKRWLGEWQGYQTETQAKVSLFQSKINAWASDWQGKKAKQDGAISAEQLLLEKNKQELELFRTQWDGINIQAQALATQMRSALDKADFLLKNEQTRLAFLAENAKQVLEAARVGPEVAIQKARLELEASLAPMERVAQLQVGVAQAYISAIDASFSMRGEISQAGVFDVQYVGN